MQIIASFLGSIVKALITPVLWMWAGAQRVRRIAAERSVKVKDEQLKAANRRARDRDELVDRVRDGEF